MHRLEPICCEFLTVFSPDDTVGDLKKLIAAQTGTKWDRIVLKKWYLSTFCFFYCLQIECLGLLSHKHLLNK